MLSLWLWGKPPQSVGAPFGHWSWQKGSPIQTPAIQTNVYQGPVWQHAYGRFVGRCKAMGALELFVQFQATQARETLCSYVLFLKPPNDFGIPMDLPFALVTSLKDSTRMANVNAYVLGWVQRKGPCFSMLNFEQNMQSMSNMHSLIHDPFLWRRFSAKKAIARRSRTFWKKPRVVNNRCGKYTHVCQQWPQIEN